MAARDYLNYLTLVLRSNSHTCNIFNNMEYPAANFIENRLIVEDDLVNARVFFKDSRAKQGGLHVKHTENVEEVMQITAGKPILF